MNKTKKLSFFQLFPVTQEAISLGNSFSFTAFGSSMTPFIAGGKDKVTLSPLSAPLKKNDVIFYKREDGSFVLHRIVKAKGDSFDLCGDNQFSIEKGITSPQVIAILTSVQKGKKKYTSGNQWERIWCFFLPLRRLWLHFTYRVKNSF